MNEDESLTFSVPGEITLDSLKGLHSRLGEIIKFADKIMLNTVQTIKPIKINLSKVGEIRMDGIIMPQELKLSKFDKKTAKTFIKAWKTDSKEVKKLYAHTGMIPAKFSNFVWQLKKKEFKN